MADTVLARDGYTAMLASMVDAFSVWIHLYTAGGPPSIDSVVGDFTEATYPGYAPLGGGRWTPPFLRAGLAFSNLEPVDFVATGPPWPDPILGYYATWTETGPLLWAWERPNGAFVFTAGSQVLTVFAKLWFPSCPS